MKIERNTNMPPTDFKEKYTNACRLNQSRGRGATPSRNGRSSDNIRYKLPWSAAP